MENFASTLCAQTGRVAGFPKDPEEIQKHIQFGYKIYWQTVFHQQYGTLQPLKSGNRLFYTLVYS